MANKIVYPKKKLLAGTLAGTNALSGCTSILGSYQLCHSLCLTLISLLSIVGITVAGMPLMFLTKVTLPFWIAAVSLLAISIILKITIMRNLSAPMLFLNAGLIMAGIPFSAVQDYRIYLYIAGGSIAIISLLVLSASAWRIHNAKNR